ncbi:motility associated factor glycosyltransferase family protein [Legionella sp. km772]|uniref:motility associated factor glycosyltransferase family protein n=1 Tax=Legionella sp. km772 TaxID=2498111 RepID=UPI000F8C97F6|nr:6-hydroxymethylpterin diphosphokinase MptE-like protein [Legionella sp. km772]RUR10266.1 DUF115 domain-containing protein [Legionella sp. km772]
MKTSFMDNTVYQKNFAILKSRWPSLIAYLETLDGNVDINFLEGPEPTLVYKKRHLTSCYNRSKEAEIQNSTIPSSSPKASLYGVGLGDGIANLLKRESLKQLDIYILSPILFYVYINFFDATDWLKDKRVHLDLARERQLNFPYAVNTGELPFTEDAALAIKNLIYSDRNRANETRHERQNYLLYEDNLQKNHPFICQDDFVDSMVNRHPNKKFVVVAGGPTATEQFAWIKKNKAELIIIAASTALMPLEVAHIIPDYVVIIDPSPKLVDHLALNNINNFKNKTLVYSPVGCHAAISKWPGRRKIFLNQNPLLQALISKHPQSELYSGGSVAHTNVALALLLGAKELILVGYDFCFPFAKSHLEHSAFAHQTTQDTEMMVLNGYNKKIKSFLNLITYKAALEEFIAIHPEIKFYNTGKDGAIIKGAEWISL